MKKNVMILILVLLVFISECTNINLENLKVTETKKEETSDVLVIENIDTLPRPPIFAGDSFTLYFTLRNRDEQRPIENIRVTLFDPSVFKGNLNPNQCGENNPCSLLPLDQKLISFNLTAPTQEEIASVEVTPKVNFKVTYAFNGTTAYDVVIVNIDELTKYQQAGKTLDLTRNKLIGSGPIKIDVELINADAVIAGRTGRIKVVVKNDGSGNLIENKISKNGLRIDFGSLQVSHSMKNLFNCINNVCINIGDEIKIIGKESSPLLFNINAPANIELWRTLVIMAKVDYTYELRGSKGITVKPVG
ncbi:MAG: hypothetical protein QXQ40_00705 [Candidatus Aenigmatarchaeota archaeon]